MNYAKRWTLAVALKQPYPRPETGDVAPEASTTSNGGGIAFSPAEIRTAFQNASKAVWVFTGGGVVVGGIVGYLIGKARK